jgi:hypothetical protein
MPRGKLRAGRTAQPGRDAPGGWADVGDRDGRGVVRFGKKGMPKWHRPAVIRRPGAGQAAANSMPASWQNARQLAAW